MAAWAFVRIVTVVALLASLSASPAAAQDDPGPLTVIGIADTHGLNILHSDFANPKGLALPPGLPPVTEVDLPASGSFEERLAEAKAGIFSRLRRGVLYHVRATRLLLYAGGEGEYDIFRNPGHGTATASSAVGLEAGSSPDSFLLVVGDGIGHPQSWDWVLQQPWIDLITTSTATIMNVVADGTCPDARYVRTFSHQGRPWFTYAGNADQFHIAFAPTGIPEAYRVGGVDDSGRSLAAYVSDDDPATVADTPTRPYETGDFYYRSVATSDSLDGHSLSGGTSFAGPATAGRAGNLIRYARGLVHDPDGGVQDGKLVVAGPAAPLPASGPLADGDLTREELFDLLHHVAIPAEPPSPGRYLVEGYGALNDDTMRRAERVLAGTEPEPQRPDEDAAHAIADPATGVLFPTQRCG